MNYDLRNAGTNSLSEDEVSVAELWRIIVSEKIFILSAAVLLGLASLAASFAFSPAYRAEVLLAPVSADAGKDRLGGLANLAGQLGGLSALAGINVGQSNTRAVSVATLKSRVLTERYIKDENLLPILFASQWDERNRKWRTENPKKIPTLWDGNKLFVKKIRDVSENKTTGLVTLTIDWKDPVLAAKWANDLVSRTNSYLRQIAIEESNRNIAYLEQRLAATNLVELQQAIAALLGSEIKNVMLAQGNNEFAFHVIDPAAVPQERSFPRRVVFTIAGFLLGLVGGIFFVLMRRPNQTAN